MGRAFFGAYWGPRAESAEECADRIGRLIRGLEVIDVLLTGWRDKAETKSGALAQPVVTTDRQDLVERLKAGVMRDDSGTVIDTAGYWVYWWNGDENDPAAITLNMSLGRTSKQVPNSVVFQFPDPTTVPSIYSAPSASNLVLTVIEVFQPERAVWLDDDSRVAQKSPDWVMPNGARAIGRLAGHPAGWATYLVDSEPTSFNDDLLPATASAERIGDGTLVLLGNDPSYVPVDDVLAVRAAMGYEVPAR
jgi:hypothetical protein